MVKQMLPTTYHTGLYQQPFANYNEDIEALRPETRLELAHEGHRFLIW